MQLRQQERAQRARGGESALSKDEERKQGQIKELAKSIGRQMMRAKQKGLKAIEDKVNANESPYNEVLALGLKNIILEMSDLKKLRVSKETDDIYRTWVQEKVKQLQSIITDPLTALTESQRAHLKQDLDESIAAFEKSFGKMS